MDSKIKVTKDIFKMHFHNIISSWTR